jgi:hypothetical protein
MKHLSCPSMRWTCTSIRSSICRLPHLRPSPSSAVLWPDCTMPRLHDCRISKEYSTIVRLNGAFPLYSTLLVTISLGSCTGRLFLLQGPLRIELLVPFRIFHISASWASHKWMSCSILPSRDPSSVNNTLGFYERLCSELSFSFPCCDFRCTCPSSRKAAM